MLMFYLCLRAAALLQQAAAISPSFSHVIDLFS